MPSPARKAKDTKGTARAGIRRATGDTKASKLARAEAGYKEALEQQAATAEILRVIAGSPKDVKPVFDALLKRALKLCDASHGSLFVLEPGGLRRVAARGIGGTTPVGSMISLDSGPGRAVRKGRTVHLVDVQQELGWHAPEIAQGVRRQGIRTVWAAPLILGRKPIGAI